MGITPPEPINENHDVTGFDCGNSSLNEWLQKRALKNENSGASRTFVVPNGKTVIAYYSLAVGAVAREESSGKVRRNMPEPIPVMVLGRLAVDKEWQGKQMGVGLLKDAILRTLIVAEQAGIRALLVHALSDDAKRFYLRCGFHESPANELTLMITLEEARQVM
ncbi:MAG: GNAT family N-acetyltransferase [Gammaproteobacteria bacterium]|nr:GNAT family N-acetyltransferase [Gammaproteobacteria bacterium]MDH5692621.1 GNAT family N-acetyltransferase [Gammaproteobacteria bacterium]